MGQPAPEEILAARPGILRPLRAQLDAIEVTQAIQDLGHSVPLIARKRTFVRVYLGLTSGSFNVRGELKVSRTGHAPWLTVPSVGGASLDASRTGLTLAQLRTRRDDVAYSLDFRLPPHLTRAGKLWVRLWRVREFPTGRHVHVTDPVGTQQFTFVGSPRLRLHVINLRYTTGSPPVTYAASATDLALLESWLRRAYPVAGVRFSTVTVNATAAWPFNSGQANAQVAAIRALDVAGGTDPGTHYYGIVADGGGFMRGSAAGIPGTPDPSVVASGPTGDDIWAWDTDGSYGDWYGGHELGHTFGRLHPGFCGESNDDPAYPFTAGQLADADDRFVGFDVGHAALGLPVAALPGTGWHDVMTYCPTQWLSSYTYRAIRDRLVDEAALFPEPTGPPAGMAMSLAGSNDPMVHVTGLVNLTKGSGSIEHVTPLPGLAQPAAAAPAESRVIVRTRASDGSVTDHVVELKPDLCRLPGEDEMGLVDATVDVDPTTTTIELLLDGEAIGSFQVGGEPGAPQNIELARAEAAPPIENSETGGITVAGTTLSWDEPTDAATAGNTYVVQASTDQGATWRTLAVDATSPSLSLDPTNFADAEQVRFRVLTTNGLTYSETTTDDVPVDDL